MQDYVLSQQEVAVNERLGGGSLGEAFRGNLHGKIVCVKKLSAQIIERSTEPAFRREVEVMCALKHPNVVLTMGVVVVERPEMNEYWLVTEYLGRGTLASVLAKEGSNLGASRRVRMLKEVAQGMNWLHHARPPILHLMLRGSNIMISEDYEAKVADYGLGRFVPAAKRSPSYASPEMLIGQEYDEKADVYSFGMLMYHVYTGVEPFSGDATQGDALSLAVRKGYRPVIPAGVPPLLKEVMEGCWATVPSMRPSFDHMLDERMFDRLLVEWSIRDHAAADFWMKNFLGQERVPWADFETAFWKHFGVKETEHMVSGMPSKMDAVRLVATAGSPDNYVTLLGLGTLVETFGPFAVNIFEATEEMLQRDYFHAFLPTRAAEELLHAKKPGSYLVRFSSTEPGSFAISAKTKTGQLAHYRVHHKAGADYVVSEEHFPSLEATIQAMKRKHYLRTVIKSELLPPKLPSPLKK